LVIVAVFFLCRDVDGRLFSPNNEQGHAVVGVVSKLVPILCIMFPIKSVSSILSAVLTGQGRPYLVTVTGFVSGPVTLGLAYLFCFQISWAPVHHAAETLGAANYTAQHGTSASLEGLFWGTTLGETLVLVLYGVIVMRSDWQSLALQAMARSEVAVPVASEKVDEEDCGSAYSASDDSTPSDTPSGASFAVKTT
jgi:Na+-driven multidrug efflux pump